MRKNTLGLNLVMRLSDQDYGRKRKSRYSYSPFLHAF